MSGSNSKNSGVSYGRNDANFSSSGVGESRYANESKGNEYASNILYGLDNSFGNRSSGGSSSFGQQVFDPGTTRIFNNQALLGYGSNNQLLNETQPDTLSTNAGLFRDARDTNRYNASGGVIGGLNIGDELKGSLQRSRGPTNTQQIYQSIIGGQGNTSLDALKGSLEANATRANNLNSATIDQQAAAAGQSGSTRQGVQQALTRDDTNRNLQNTEAQLGYDTFNTDLNRKLDIANLADTNTLQRQQFLGNLLGQQQGTVNSSIDNAGNLANLLRQGINSVMGSRNENLVALRQALGDPTVLNQGTSGSFDNALTGSNASNYGASNSGSSSYNFGSGSSYDQNSNSGGSRGISTGSSSGRGKSGGVF